MEVLGLRLGFWEILGFGFVVGGWEGRKLGTGREAIGHSGPAGGNRFYLRRWIAVDKKLGLINAMAHFLSWESARFGSLNGYWAFKQISTDK